MAIPIVPLAIVPTCSSADVERASAYKKTCCCEGRWSEPDDLVFYFTRHDGNSDRFSAPELRAATWWQALPFDAMLTVEAYLYGTPKFEPRYQYVACSDRSAGGKLIAGSRLSDYFEGDSRETDAATALAACRAAHPDAKIFQAEDIDDAERLLANPDEGSLLVEERMALARFERAMERTAGGRGTTQ